MDIETKQANLKIKKVFGTDEFAVNGKIDIDGNIKKILYVNAISSVQNFETLDTNCNISGRIQVSAACLLDGGIKNVVSDFPYTTNMQVLSQDISIFTQAKDIKFEQNQNSIDISVLVNAEAIGFENQEITEIESQDEAVVLKTEDIAVNTAVNAGESKFTQSLTIELDKQDAQILYVNASSNIDKAESFVDQITISANCEVKIGYVSDNIFYEMSKIVEYNQEISCLNALTNMKTAASVNVAGVNYVQDSQNVNIVVSLNSYVSCYKQEILNITKDAYSIENNLQINYECKNYIDFVEQKHMNANALAKIDGINDAVILGLFNYKAKIAKTEIQNGILTVDCIVFAKELYKFAENEELNTCDVNIPLVLKTPTNAKSVDDVVVDINKVTINKNNEVEIESIVSFVEQKETYIEFVDSMKEAERKEEEQSAITVYIAKPNQSIFDVAKALNVLPDSVDTAELIDGKFNGGEKIFVYNPINAEF